MPKDCRNETHPDNTPSRCARIIRPRAWVLPALLFVCVAGFAVSPDIWHAIAVAKARQPSGAPPLAGSASASAPDTVALQQRIAELDRQMDTVNAAMSRLTVSMQRRDEESARSVDRITELHQDLNTLVLQLKHREHADTAPSAAR